MVHLFLGARIRLLLSVKLTSTSRNSFKFLHCSSAWSTVFGSSPFYLHQRHKKDKFKGRTTNMANIEPSTSDKSRDGKISAGEPRFKRPRFEEIGDFGKKAADKAYLSIVSNGAPAFGKSFFLFTTGSCYLFNCPEMTDRNIDIGHSVKINRFEHIFFTQPNWENCGGLPGFVQTLHGSGIKTVTVHGAPFVKQILESTKPYVDERIEIILKESNFENEHFEDDTIKMEYIPLFTHEYATQRQAYVDALERGVGQLAKALENVNETAKKVSVAFLFQLKVRGFKIDNAKLQAYRAKPGPWIKELVEGNTVTLDDGRVITPDDVRQTQKGPGRFLVVDCPSTKFLKATFDNKRIKSMKESGPGEQYLDLVVHLTSVDIYDSLEYQEWIHSFGPNTNHIALNERCPYVFHSEGLFKMQTQLNLVNPQIFPKLNMFNWSPMDFDKTPGSLNLVEPFVQYHLKPNEGLSRPETAFDFDENEVLQGCHKLPDFTEKLTTYHASQAYRTCLDIKCGTYPEIIFLGTSSSVPTKYRNVSGILINLNSESSIILDCGEGTYQQMFHLLGQDVTDKVLTNLKCVFISHMHMDHHLGIITLLKRRREAFRRKNKEFEILKFLAPAPLFGMYELYSTTVENLNGEYCYIKTKPKESQEYANWYIQLSQLASHLGVQQIQPVKVDHPMLACGLVLHTNCGRKLVYSGDTMPCPALIKEGMGADVLIHEATFGESLEDMAKTKKHSTINQAINVGKQMKAKYTILTHFSARYSKFPIIPKEEVDNKSLIVAMDCMKLNWGQLQAANEMIPVLQTLYHSEIEEASRKEYMRAIKNKTHDQARDRKVERLKQILQA